MGASAHASVYRKNLRYPISFYSLFKRRAALKQNKKAQEGSFFFIYYISPKVGSPESRTQQLVRFWLAPFYLLSQALTRLCNQTKALTPYVLYSKGPFQ